MYSIPYFRDPEPFEWYYGYDVFKDIIVPHVDKGGYVLVAGCGNSHFMEEMVEDGYEQILGVDISRVVLAIMKARCKDFPEISFVQADMCDTNLPEKTYDAVIDKALLDSVLCNPNGGEKFVQSLIYEVQLLNEFHLLAHITPRLFLFSSQVVRLLKDDGVYICISHGNPEDRLKFLEQYDLELPCYTPWYVDVQAVRKYSYRN